VSTSNWPSANFLRTFSLAMSILRGRNCCKMIMPKMVSIDCNQTAFPIIAGGITILMVVCITSKGFERLFGIDSKVLKSSSRSKALAKTVCSTAFPPLFVVSFQPLESSLSFPNTSILALPTNCQKLRCWGEYPPGSASLILH
jgi:hypothetical protein